MSLSWWLKRRLPDRLNSAHAKTHEANHSSALGTLDAYRISASFVKQNRNSVKLNAEYDALAGVRN